MLGHVVLLDTYVNRLELPPAAGASDLRRTPINYQDLVDLHPEAIFLGHGHGDHADNAAYIAAKTGARIYASEETCTAMQADFDRMNALYREFFAQPYPARTTVTAGLRPGVRFEITAQAYVA